MDVIYIFTDEHFVVQSLHCIACQRIVFARAKNQANWRILAGLHPMFACKIAIKIHLSDVGVNQRGNFQVNDDQTA